MRLRQIPLSAITLEGEKYILTDKSQVRVIEQSENLFFHTLFRIIKREFPPTYRKKQDHTSEVFILTTPAMKDNEDNQEQRNKFESNIRNGIWIDGKQYLRTICSTSMKRNQKTMFVEQQYKEKMDEIMSLGTNKKIKECLISKFDASIGLSLSSANLIKDKPRIVIIEDMFKFVNEDVLMVQKYTSKPEDVENIQKVEQLKLKRQQIWEESQIAKDKADWSNERLSKLPKAQFDVHKSRNGWKEQNRYVRPTEYDNPVAHVEYDGLLYPAFTIDQTEKEIIIPVLPCSVEKELVLKQNHPVKINCFDGMGLCSSEWAERTSKKLELTYTPNAYQIRNAMVKGMIVNFDFHSYFADKGISTIVDRWGDSHEISKVDWILTESQCKMALEKGEQQDPWLFASIKVYQDALDKYGFDHIGICAVSKRKEETNPYLVTAYQHLQAFNLNYKDLLSLAKPTIRMIKELLSGRNIAWVKTYLGMYPNDDEEEYELRDYLSQALDINHDMLYDHHFKHYLLSRAKYLLEQVLQGRLFVKGFKHFIVGDVLAFAEWAAHRDEKKVKGFLKSGEQFAKDKNGIFSGVRNPLVHFSEVVRMNYVDWDNEYINHLTDITQLSIYDLVALRAGGADLDGDFVQVFDNEILIRNIIDSPVVMANPEEAPVAVSKPLNIESIVEYELFSLYNATGQVTNIATTFSNRSNNKHDGNPSHRNFEVAILKILQGSILDSQKTFEQVDVPEVLQVAAHKKPYFMVNIDYGESSKYEKREYANSPFNRLVKHAEDRLNKVFINKDKSYRVDASVIENYIYPRDAHKLLMADNLDWILIDNLKPIYTDFIDGKQDLKDQYSDEKIYGKEARKRNAEQRRIAYSKLNQEIKKRARELTDNGSKLATAAVYVSYILTKNSGIDNRGYKQSDKFDFAWVVAPESIISNLRMKENTNKIDILPIKELDHLPREYSNRLTVRNGVGVIDETIINTTLSDGQYIVYNILGRHFTDIDIEREVKLQQDSYNPDLEPISDYALKIISFNPTFSVYDVNTALLNKELKIGRNKNKYISLFDGDDCIGSVAKEFLLTENFNLEKYYGHLVTVKAIKKKWSKSVLIVVDVV